MIIYKTINLVNGKFYIGKDINNDPKYLGSGTILKRAIKKYGRENFKKELLEECDSFEQLNDREIYWIGKLNAINVGYNLIEGGSGGIKGWYDSKRNRKINERLLINRYELTDKLCEEIIDDHLSNKMHLKEIYKKYGITLPVINYIFKKYNIQKLRYKNSGNFKKQFIISDEIKIEIIRLYVEEEYMQTELQTYFELPEIIIKNILDENNIKTRSNKEPISDREQKYRKRLKTSDDIIRKIIDLRENENMVLSDIEKKVNLGYTVIKRVLNENGLSSKRLRWKK